MTAPHRPLFAAPTYGPEFTDAEQAIDQAVQDAVREIAHRVVALETLYRGPDHGGALDRRVYAERLAELRRKAELQLGILFDLARDVTRDRWDGAR